MIICTEMQAIGENERAFKRRALRDAVICIGWLKLLSVVCYVGLYFLIHTNSSGHLSTVLQVMTLVAIPFQVFHGVLLFMGALEQKMFALELSLWLCLILASYNTVLGLMGAIYFIRKGKEAIHFVVAAIFALLAISLFTVLCHDILIIYAYKQILEASRNLVDEPQVK